MKVALVHPPEPYSSIASNITQHPINLASLAAYIMQFGHEVEIWDFAAEPPTKEHLINRLKSFMPQVVGFSCMTPLIKTGHKMAEIIKSCDPDITTIVGGPHVSAVPKETLLEFPSFDIGVIGEGEITLKEILENLKDGVLPKGLAGTAYREDGDIKVGPMRPLISDLNELPYPKRELINFDLYLGSSSPGLSAKIMRITEIFTSRGCPHRCIFCGSHITHRQKVRFRSPEHLMGEIIECIERFKIEHFTIDDDTFTYGKDRLMKILRGFKELKISWDCDSRVDSVSPEILEAMAEAGCKKVAFGVETGSPRILELIRKKITVEQIENAFKWARKAGILSSAFIMIGSHPSETIEDLKYTLELLYRVRPDFVLVYIAVPYPGTELYQIMKEKGYIFTEDWDEFDIVRTEAKWRNDNFMPDDLVKYQKWMYRKYYLRPGFILKKLVSAHSFKEFEYLFSAGFDFVKYVFGKKRKGEPVGARIEAFSSQKGS